MSLSSHFDFKDWTSAELEEVVKHAQLEILSRREATIKRREREAARARAEGISLQELHERDASRSLHELLYLAGRIDS